MKRAGVLKSVLLDGQAIQDALQRMADGIREKTDSKRLALVGIQTGGVVLAKRLQKVIAGASGLTPQLGSIDITLYRDDLAQSTHFPELRATNVLFDVDGADIVLVDDVLYTGRTIRAALDALMDLGRPRAVRLAVLMDRGGRELPIAPDFMGRQVVALPKQTVTVQLAETDGADQVVLEDLP
jgi:pyrimidine operon attenuation protein/uracil phosphoribosyltransferase